MQFADIVLVVGGTLTGLLAGVFYAFSVAIVPALRSIKGESHIAAMQAINVKIENPVFFLSFFGPTFLLPLAAFLYRGLPQFGLLVVASILHIVGANGATIAGDIPLNNELAKRDAYQLSEAEAEQIRTEFQRPGSAWMKFHHIRTFAAIAATALVFIACLSKNTSR
ncbi:DUF1772 domain-containing protein [Ktedonosporobacter rubrisoli]|uniref:anthrone oxygenase family protein n=1 Tax=Ktedonosporobacter rubrisoli TaxID=2509675 RepID=UPI0013EEE7D1|nr:anthrone oxygenase family protein [Ktedonosporobacter rubrisoli]